MEESHSFDFLLCSRAPLAAPCEETILKIARLSSRAYFNISRLAQVRFLPSRSFVITKYLVSNLTLTWQFFYYARVDRKKWYTENDWRVKHAVPLAQWEERQRMDPESGPAHRHNHYKEYLRWFHSVARVSVKPPLENVPIEDRADTNNDDDIVDEYDDITREGVQPERAPLQN